MIERYFIDEWQHDALIRAARYGKTCRILSEIDRAMCDCAEEHLKDIAKFFDSKRLVVVTFHYAEHQIPALEKAWGLLRQEQSLETGWNLIVDGKFPDFEKAVPSIWSGVKCWDQAVMEERK